MAASPVVIARVAGTGNPPDGASTGSVGGKLRSQVIKATASATHVAPRVVADVTSWKRGLLVGLESICCLDMTIYSSVAGLLSEAPNGARLGSGAAARAAPERSRSAVLAPCKRASGNLSAQADPTRGVDLSTCTRTGGRPLGGDSDCRDSRSHSVRRSRARGYPAEDPPRSPRSRSSAVPECSSSTCTCSR